MNDAGRKTRGAVPSNIERTFVDRHAPVPAKKQFKCPTCKSPDPLHRVPIGMVRGECEDAWHLESATKGGKDG